MWNLKTKWAIDIAPILQKDYSALTLLLSVVMMLIAPTFDISFGKWIMFIGLNLLCISFDVICWKYYVSDKDSKMYRVLQGVVLIGIIIGVGLYYDKGCTIGVGIMWIMFSHDIIFHAISKDWYLLPDYGSDPAIEGYFQYGYWMFPYGWWYGVKNGRIGAMVPKFVYWNATTGVLLGIVATVCF